MPSKRQRIAAALDDYLSVVSSGLADLDYAVGGAIAMAEHGYSRATSDLDVFVPEESMEAALAALRNAGLRVERVFEGLHYIAYRPEHDLHPDVRIDILVVYDDPEWSAAAAPDEIVTEDGLALKITPLDLLALTRFYSDQPRHEQDLAAMIARGMVHRDRAAMLLAHIDAAAVPEWNATYDRLARKRSARQRPNRRG